MKLNIISTNIFIILILLSNIIYGQNQHLKIREMEQARFKNMQSQFKSKLISMNKLLNAKILFFFLEKIDKTFSVWEVLYKKLKKKKKN